MDGWDSVGFFFLVTVTYFFHSDFNLPEEPKTGSKITRCARKFFL